MTFSSSSTLPVTADKKRGNAHAHNNLGCSLYKLGQLADAESSFRQALKLKPNFADALINLGTALRNRGRIIESESTLRRALKIKPNSVDALQGLGLTLTLLCRLDEAETCQELALKINPDHPGALAGMADSASNWGQFEKAEALFRRALEFDPKMLSAWSAISGLRKLTPDDYSWIRTVEDIIRNGLAPHQEFSLRYAMGKYFDDVHDFERAFLNYRCANELKKTIVEKYDRQRQPIFVDAMIRIFNQDKISKVQDSASASARPVFIVGMMRSGTTLTEQIIASHRAAFGAGELMFWSDAFNKHSIAIQAPRLSDTMISDLASDYLQLISSLSADSIRIVDKMPGNFACLGLIHSVFPNARIIHMQRNPIDTCLSIYFQNYSPIFSYANDLADLAHFYREYHRLMAHWREVLPSGILLDVPYEALVRDQEKWSRQILEFIGLDWDERCLDFHMKERRVGTASKWQVRQKIYLSSIDRWHNYEEHIGPLMELMDLSQ